MLKYYHLSSTNEEVALEGLCVLPVTTNLELVEIRLETLSLWAKDTPFSMTDEDTQGHTQRRDEG